MWLSLEPAVWVELFVFVNEPPVADFFTDILQQLFTPHSSQSVRKEKCQFI